MDKKFIPYGRQWVEDDDIEAVVNVLRGRLITTGPVVKDFEEAFASYVGAKFAVAVANGTAALHAACYAGGVTEGNEVITSPITFAASANCVLYQKGKPVFADIDSKTYNISPDQITKKITSKTKAIIPVHFTGQPCNIDKIHEIAVENNLIVIEDAAHALGASYKEKKIGSLSDMSIFSFHPVKHITTGEGGMITTNSEKLYHKLLQFRTHGISKDPDKFFEDSPGLWYYEQQFLGYNYRLTDIQAALGLNQLKKADMFLTRRREIVEKYNKSFSKLDGVIIPYQAELVNSSWHLYILQFDLDKFKIDRKGIFDRLREENVGANVHYIPVYYHPYYQQLGYKKGICPIAETLYERIITIPLYPAMNDKDIDDIISRVSFVVNDCLL